jgi:crotonobetainyl-CoA:carnitine CoA-transferase CaiB-like acyl-CoA transferase
MDEDGIENPFSKVEKMEELDMVSMSREMLEVYESALSQFFLKHTKEELETEGRKRGINAAIINNPSEVMGNPHLIARDYWTTIPDRELNKQILYPRHLFLHNSTENFISRPAPEIGQHNSEIYGQELGLSDAEINSLQKENII